MTTPSCLPQGGTALDSLVRWGLLLALPAGLAMCLSVPSTALAVPAFARQTGEQCGACHAGGQFPELTSFGRLFKLTGYSLGTQHLPLAVMGVVGDTKTAHPRAGGVPPSAFVDDGRLTLQSASVFLAGKLNDYAGIMSQWTYTPHGGNDLNTSHSSVDNSELRVANRWNGGGQDLIAGAFLNNNPTMEDVWNSTPAWGYPYVQSAFGQSPVAAPVVDGSLAQQAVGVGVYAYLNQSWYAELAAYSSARGPWAFLRAGDLGTRFSSPAPYARLAWTHDWGANSVMIGALALNASLHDDPADAASPTSHLRDMGIDAQYQYGLDPHAITAHLSWIRERQTWGSDLVASGFAPQGTLTELKVKGAYTFANSIGGSLAWQRWRGSPSAGLYATGDPLSGSARSSPDTSVWIPEVYWLPDRRLRLGLQLWHYTRFNGSSANYSGLGRNANDNDMVFLYAWFAY